VLIEPWAAGQTDLARCMHRLKTAFGSVGANRIRVVVADRVPLTEQGKADRTAIGKILQSELQSSRAPLQSILTESSLPTY
jgi:fatty-acyl-CoA synthase